MRDDLPRRGPRRSRGFTLIEVVITALVIGIGLVGVGSMITLGTISHRKAVNYTIAAQRANEELERIREAGFLSAQVDIALFPSPAYRIASDTQAEFDVSDLRQGQGVVTIQDDPEALQINPATGNPYGNMKRVTVEITWSGSRTLRGAYSVTTLIANRA